MWCLKTTALLLPDDIINDKLIKFVQYSDLCSWIALKVWIGSLWWSSQPISWLILLTNKTVQENTQTRKSKQCTIQQNKTIQVQSPLTTLCEEMRWAYATVLLSPHVAIWSQWQSVLNQWQHTTKYWKEAFSFLITAQYLCHINWSGKPHWLNQGVLQIYINTDGSITTQHNTAELNTNLLDESDRIFSRFFILIRSTSRSVDKHDTVTQCV